MRFSHLGTSGTSMGNELSLTKSFGMVQVSKGTTKGIPVQILKHRTNCAQKFRHRNSTPYNPPWDIPPGRCFFTGPWTVTRSSLRMLRRVTAF